MTTAPKIPDSTKDSLHWRLAARARERWPDLTEVQMRYRAGFAYVDGVLPSGSPSGSAEEALDCACGLYLNDPTAWASDPRRINGENH